MSHSTNLEVKFSQHIPTEAAINKYLGTSHGYSLAALSMIEHTNQQLVLEITFDGTTQLQSAADQIFAILQRSDSVPVTLRSVKSNGKFESSYFGKDNLQQDNSPPTSPDKYTHNNGAILDILINPDGQVWNFYRLPEGVPRQLKLHVRG